MKITFVSPGFPTNGGVKRIIMLSNLLSERGHEVNIVIHKGEATCDWYDVKVPVIVNYDLDEKKFPNADAIIVYECIEPEYLLRIKNFKHNKGKKYLLVLSYGYQKSDWIKHNIKLKNFTKICTTEWLRDSCDALGEEKRTSRELLLTGIDHEQFQHVRLFGKSYIPPSGIVIGAYYKYGDYVCFDELQQVFLEVKKKHPDINLITYSNKDAPVSFSRHYKDPPQEKLKELYSSCDIWLCTNSIEGLGMPPLEAMACGCCLVTTDTKGNNFYAIHNKTALVSKPGDIQDLIKNLNLVIEDAQLRHRLSMSGQKLASSLSWESSVIRLEKILMNDVNVKTLSIICTNYNRKGLTKKWLKNIEQRWPKISTELIMIDDCSTDGTSQFLSKYKKNKKSWYDSINGEFNLILKDKNTGFADTCKVAQEQANSDWILITQNDVEFSSGSIDALIATFERLENELGDIGCIGIAGGLVQRKARGEVLTTHDWSHWNGDGLIGYKQKIAFDYVQVDYLNGFLLLYRGDVARKKGIYFDPRYRFYWEDIDICYQFSRIHKLRCLMVSMDANSIPHINHIRNQTITKIIPEYQQVNDEMEKVFRKKWYG